MGYTASVSRVKVLDYRGDRVRVEITRSTLSPFNIGIKILGSRVIDGMYEEIDRLRKRIDGIRKKYGLGNAKVVLDNGVCVATYMECDYDGCITYNKINDKGVCDELLPVEKEYYRLRERLRKYLDELSSWMYSILGDGGLG